MENLKEKLNLFSLGKEEPAWFLEKRQEALALIDTLKLPSFQRAKYNDFKLLNQPLAENDFETSEELSANILPDFLGMENQPFLFQTDSVTNFSQLPQDLIDAGVIFCDLQSAIADYPELVKKYYMTTAVKADENKLTAFHSAFVDNGSFLYVPDNVEIKEPIEVVFAQTATNRAYVKHVLIVAGRNAKFSYLERFIAPTESEVEISANIIAEVIAGPGSTVKYSAMDQLGKNVTAYVNRRGYLLKDAMIDWAIGVMSDGNILADFDTDLVGDGAHSEIKAVAISSGQQKQIIDTRVTNKAPHTVGHILQHGVIMDQATLTFNGIGHILKGAHGSDAQQESRVLMLSDGARGDANPILLIDDNDVTAGHAASVGQLDPSELYYLMSRGLKEDQAQRLVIRGFLGSVITAIPVKKTRDEFIEVIEGKLHAEI